MPHGSSWWTFSDTAMINKPNLLNYKFAPSGLWMKVTANGNNENITTIYSSFTKHQGLFDAIYMCLLTQSLSQI